MTPPAIRIRGLKKAFRPRRPLSEVLRFWRPRPVVHAIRGLDLDVKSGELLALVGPNGAGKTTLLEVLADLVVPDQGEVEVLGHRLHTGPQIRASVGYVLAEERSFFLRLTVKENLLFFARLEGIPTPEARIEEISAALGLDTLLLRRFAELSRGQKQRVGIARGLLPDPPILLFDEATRALDPGRAGRFRRLVREVLVERDRRTIIFATHQLDEAAELADRAALMIEGRLEALGSWSEVSRPVEQAFAREADEEDRALAELLVRRGLDEG